MSQSSAHPGSKTLQVSAPPSQSVGLSTDVHNSVDIALSTTDPSCPSDRFRRAMPPCLSVAPVLTTLPASPAQCLSHRFTGNDDAHHGADASLSRAPAGAPLSAVHSPHQSLSSYQVSRQTCLLTNLGLSSCLALRMERGGASWCPFPVKQGVAVVFPARERTSPSENSSFHVKLSREPNER